MVHQQDMGSAATFHKTVPHLEFNLNARLIHTLLVYKDLCLTPNAHGISKILFLFFFLFLLFCIFNLFLSVIYNDIQRLKGKTYSLNFSTSLIPQDN